MGLDIGPDTQLRHGGLGALAPKPSDFLLLHVALDVVLKTRGSIVPATGGRRSPYNAILCSHPAWPVDDNFGRRRHSRRSIVRGQSTSLRNQLVTIATNYGAKLP